MRSYATYVFDLDGTLYRGNQVITGAPEVVKAIRKGVAKIVFLTNNSSLTPSDFVAKLTRLGFEAEESEVISSATATALYCRDHKLSPVFVVGEPGLVSVLEAAGILVTQDPLKAKAVVSGICKTRLSYPLLNDAMQAILGGAKFIATNTDATFPLENDTFAPGSGATIAFLQTCTGVSPTVIGKPNPLVLAGIDICDCLLVGDRLDTDIACGLAAGCDVALVTTGVDKTAPEGIRMIHSLSELLN
jgi:4-nitrophenyl phosphatase